VKVTIALVAGVVGLGVLAAAVIAVVLGLSARADSSPGADRYAGPALLATALGAVGIVTSTTLTLWLLV
jgi:hypothetical protein